MGKGQVAGTSNYLNTDVEGGGCKDHSLPYNPILVSKGRYKGGGVLYVKIKIIGLKQTRFKKNAI